MVSCHVLLRWKMLNFLYMYVPSQLERGIVLLGKFDIENAYRMVPVHPVDRMLLGTQWRGELYVNSALPFSLRSAPKIFTAIADCPL